MRHGLRSRATAALLAALFLGGVGGASDLDAFLFHRGATVVAGVSHVETASGAGCHAQRCLLALRIANGRVTPVLQVPVRFEGMPQYDAGSRPAAAPHRSDGGFLQQSRAPPAPLA